MKNIQAIVIGALFVTGISSAAMATLVFQRSAAKASAPMLAPIDTVAACKARLAPLGGSVEIKARQIIWTKTNISEASILVGEASVAAQICPGWKMTKACIGEDCPAPNSFQLTLMPATNGLNR